ncbi:YibE/F family protein [Aminipila sp.]|uniref:YibE/F family protein n=1 Tax=Aminipila sp. TaxID=2060095 RepID=UPI001D62EF01|nr:YibE/F family protein [Aminipila sp.]MBE6034378.1 YibE/F family protein [Clostridiales bacterium]
MRKIYFIIILMLLFTETVSAQTKDSSVVQAEVMDMVQEYANDSNIQIARLKILEGKYKNKELFVQSLYIESSEYSFDLEKGKKVLVNVSSENGEDISGYIVNISRSDDLKLLIIIFLIVVALFGRTKGLLSVSALAISGIIILKFMIPFIQNGYNPLLIALISCVLIILISFTLTLGFTYKSFVAILGTAGGTVIAGVLALIFTDLCYITGLSGEEVSHLITTLGIEIDYRGLYLSGVLIGAIGVVMDVAMSITSMIFELKRHSPNVGFAKLMGSGLEVGKDIMSTMVDTLILAYVGGTMPLFLVIINSNMSLNEALSREVIAMEIIRSLCGSIGLILTIPLTSLIASFMVSVKKKSYGN